MRYFKWINLFLCLLLAGLSFAQERPVINIPNILGYKTLKCDFHMHTIFSDGQVWPTVRIDEAWRDGLDAISITDHIEYRPNLKYFFKEKEIVSDHNLSYQIAKEKADSKDVMLIKAAEITRAMPPGHCNAFFLADVNPLDTSWKDDGTGKQGWKGSGLLINNWKDAFYEAKKQGALIFWNHPGWERQQPDTTLWWPEHKWLLENKLMDGIEVVNGNSYSPEAHQWAIDKNLTIIAGSDSHGPIGGKKRPVTLVFAGDRSINSIKEALVDHRSAVFYENKLIGNRKFLDAIFFGSIAVESVKRTEEGFRIIIHNSSDIPFELSKATGNDVNLEFFDKIILPADTYSTITIFTKKPLDYTKIDLKLTVDNLMIAPGKGLPVTISLMTNKASSNDSFVKVSAKNPRYFETTDGRMWIPVMINFIMPNGEEGEVFNKIEMYFKHFSDNGGNAMRIWISSPFLEIEDQQVGEYNQVKFNRIDRVLSLAKKYDIRIKFTLQHIRSIKPESQGVASWSNRAFMAVENGGPFKNISEYINSPEGRNAYLNRVKALSKRYKNNKQIFSWELWNEMDAVDSEDWLPFTAPMLDSVKDLFPNHLIAQTLGSLHSVDAGQRYEKLLTLKNNEYITVHRYLDPGTDWGQYDPVHGPIDLLISNAVQFVYRPGVLKPIVANEHGAVEANHAGPNKLYAKDSLGVFIHDMIFTPFFCGASGCGSMWHWDSYVEKQNLWYHYQRFNSSINGIDPIKEEFVPFTFIQDSVRCYGIKGNKTTMIWCRDARSNWKTELQEGIHPEIRNDLTIELAVAKGINYTSAKVYDPWNDKWTEVQIKNGSVTLPPFLRSAVVVLN